MLSSEFLLSRAWNESIAKLIVLEGRAKANFLLEMFSSALSADETMLFHFRPGVGPEVIEHRTASKARQQQIDDYKNGFYLIDPFYLAIERATAAQALSLDDVTDQDELEASEYFTRHYGETNLIDELCYCMSDDRGGHVLLSFARSRDVGRYNAVELELAKNLAPVVLGALSLTWQHFADTNSFAPPSPEELKLHQDLKKVRNNFGRSVLTDREFEVVQMMLHGYPVDLIAERLKMAEGTTKVHRRNIYKKLDIGSKAELFSLFIDVVSEVQVDPDADPLLQYEQKPRPLT